MVVASTAIYHPSITHYLKYLSTSLGRDKLLRTLQYLARFYAWYLYRTNGTASQIAPFAAIKKQFALTRKLLRFGKNVEHFKAAAVAADSKSLDPVRRYCAIGRQLGYAGYLTLDMGTYADAAGIYKGGNVVQRLGREAYRFWMVGLTFSVCSGVYSLWDLRTQEGRIEKADAEGVVAGKRIEKERAAINMQLLSDVCDLTIPTSALGISNFDDGIVGLAGTLSSLIGIYNQWKRTA